MIMTKNRPHAMTREIFKRFDRKHTYLFLKINIFYFALKTTRLRELAKTLNNTLLDGLACTQHFVYFTRANPTLSFP